MTVEVARTPQEKGHGLMFRKSLDPDSGMLFVYERPGHLSFWMKNTIIPLSIAFIDGEGKITQIEELKPLDETLVVSDEKCRYALETARGWFSENGVEVGDPVDLSALDSLLDRLKNESREGSEQPGKDQ